MSPSKTQNRKRQRKVGHLSAIEKKYYIFCEGKQTEPLYFKGFENAIKINPMYKNAVHVEAHGVGAETLRIIYTAEEFVIDNKLENADIWCVYDKDSFHAHDFNAVPAYASTLNQRQSKVRYHVAWSNQCIEYWFILHFDWYTSNNDRKKYRAYLHKKFATFGYQRYEKDNAQLFDVLTEYGDPKQAIQRAKQRLSECAGRTDSDSVPATKVHLLVSELAKYLPDDLKSKYL